MDEYEAMLREQEEIAKARMGGFATTADRNAAIVAAYNGGVNSGQLSRQYRVSRQRIWQILGRAGIVSHSKRTPDHMALAAMVTEHRVGSFADLSRLTGCTPSRVRKSLRRHPAWDVVRQEMRAHRIAKARAASRASVEEAYRGLVATLERPATIDEMIGHGIFTATLFRLYGNNYIRKFREAMGEVR